MNVRRFVVTGHVQGVGFRAFVRDLAEDLGVSGEVWNRRDGAVELLASHEQPATLDLLGLSLRRGPGRVESVESEHAPGVTLEPGFHIGVSR